MAPSRRVPRSPTAPATLNLIHTTVRIARFNVGVVAIPVAEFLVPKIELYAVEVVIDYSEK